MRKPKLFIGSSTNNLEIARAAQDELADCADATVWSQDIFSLGSSTHGSMLKVLDESDFGLFVFAPDDITHIDGKQYQTVRDNVIFETGLFIGRLGPERSFIITPQSMGGLHIPTDLGGVTFARFNNIRWQENNRASLGPACRQIFRQINELGSIKRQSELLEKTLVFRGASASAFLAAASCNYKDNFQSYSPNLPLQIADVVNKLTYEYKPGSLRKDSILWVDDVPQNNVYEQQAFEDLDVVVSPSHSTDNALDQLERKKFTIIISDLKRGENDNAGIELLTEIERRKISTPVFIYSKSTTESTETGRYNISIALGFGAKRCIAANPVGLYKNVMEAILELNGK